MLRSVCVLAAACVLQDAAAFCPSAALQVNVPLRAEDTWALCVSNLHAPRLSLLAPYGNESIVGSFNGAHVMSVCNRLLFVSPPSDGACFDAGAHMWQGACGERLRRRLHEPPCFTHHVAGPG
jgi:hypothetical protein